MSFSATQAGTAVDLTARIANSGNVGADHFANVRFYSGDPSAGGVQVGPTTPIRLAGCGEDITVTYRWDAEDARTDNLYVVVSPVRGGRESNNANNKLPVASAAGFIAAPASAELVPGP